MNYALVSNGVVSNIIVWDGDESTWTPPGGTQAVPISAGKFVDKEYLYDGTNFSSPSK